MNDLLKNINEHKEKNNIPVCYRLYNYILSHKITTEEELKKEEDKNFNTNDIKVRNKMKYYSFISDLSHHEKLNPSDFAKIVDYEELYEAETDELMKTKYLILIYEINKWELIFPYTAYQLIIKDMMN